VTSSVGISPNPQARHASGPASANGLHASGAASANGLHPSEAASANGLILGCEPNERALRFGLERAYRALARLTSDPGRRIELVDLANAIRPATWA
jgi:serine/threonine-protein kinase PknG